LLRKTLEVETVFTILAYARSANLVGNTFFLVVCQVIMVKWSCFFKIILLEISLLVVGIGEPAYFYVEAAFLLNGILLGVLFVFATYLR